MNCTQAEAMLAAYHELKNGKLDTTELDLHLEECASCRQTLASNMFISKQLHSLPAIEAPPDMHAKLMQALAGEHLQLMQQLEPGTLSTPEFLKPYLQEHAHSKLTFDPLATFSTAETGPLPFLQTTRKRRPRLHMNQFAVLGLAAMFLMVLMMSGLTSLLLLAHGGDPQKVASGILEPSNVAQVTYTSDTPYQHVVSAVADHNYIYYSAFTNGSAKAWVLERLERSTQISSSLLDSASANPLVVLGSSPNWLVWLQFDNPRPASQVHGKTISHLPSTPVQSWSLHYFSLNNQSQTDLLSLGKPQNLVSGTFDPGSAPNWIHTPVQGIWFIQNTLLVAMVDNNGISHLYRYQLGITGKPSSTEIASASANHILTSPTANNDGTQIYWSEEWRSDAGQLYSNIWTQQVMDAPLPAHGRIVEHTTIVKQLFRSDGLSFHPQVVNNLLFLLSAPAPDLTNALQGTQPSSTPTLAATPGTMTSPAASIVSRIDTGFLAAPLDESVRGTLLTFSLNGDSTTLPSSVNNTDHASSLQVGTDFALWQGDKGYEMYDVRTDSYVNVRNVLDGARLLDVNGDTAVWVAGANQANAANDTSSTVTLMTFNWPSTTK